MIGLSNLIELANSWERLKKKKETDKIWNPTTFYLLKGRDVVCDHLGNTYNQRWSTASYMISENVAFW